MSYQDSARIRQTKHNIFVSDFFDPSYLLSFIFDGERIKLIPLPSLIPTQVNASP